MHADTKDQPRDISGLLSQGIFAASLNVYLGIPTRSLDKRAYIAIISA